MHPRHRLDISERAILRALRIASHTRDRDAAKLAEQLEGRFDTDAIATLSVRSAFDLLLDACDLNAGDEIIMSAVTIADMGRIVEARGLAVVPVDLDSRTLAPSADAVRAAITPRTRVIVIAHLFGGRMDVAPFAALAREHGLVLVEDCAQSLLSADDSGSSLADASLFSYGPLKTATALGGAIAHVRRPALALRMRELQEEWPERDGAWYRQRVMKYAAFPPLLAPKVYAGVVRSVAARGHDVDATLNKFTRGFGSDPQQVLIGIRHRPPAALLRVLNDRLDRFPSRRLEQRAEAGQWLATRMPPALHVVGAMQAPHTHWMMPVSAPSPRALVALLRAEGFDATLARHTNIVALAPSSPTAPLPGTMTDTLARTVFLPAYPEIGSRDRARLVRTLWKATAAANPARMLIERELAASTERRRLRIR